MTLVSNYLVMHMEVKQYPNTEFKILPLNNNFVCRQICHIRLIKPKSLFVIQIVYSIIVLILFVFFYF